MDEVGERDYASGCDEVEKEVRNKSQLLERRKCLLSKLEDLDIELQVVKAKMRRIWMEVEVHEKIAIT